MTEALDHSSIDLDDASPELKRLAEDVATSGKPRVLRLAGRNVATIVPAPASGPARRKTDADVRRLLELAGSWRDHLDPDVFNRANAESRALDERPE